ncbi:MAG: shikimate dehydrogenase [Oscillospiraceae bacterium]|jgi:shikimate dehydrogenase|nr:shikimate dehydrogenase [Oscillospiraceae bacterium]
MDGDNGAGAPTSGAWEITGNTRLLAVIGSPVAHSLSPLIHNRFARALGLPYVYVAFEVTPGTLGGFIEAARALNMAGFNVTMPLKRLLLPYLTAPPGARAPGGAVNTVTLRGGELYGVSTDGDGFLLSLDLLGLDAGDGGALVLGAGGAARAVAAALRGRGVYTRVAARRPEEFPAEYADERLPWSEIARAADSAALVVNATPLGMSETNARFDGFGFLDSMRRGGSVYDLVYSPRKTRLLREAEARGLRAVNGIAMLVGQAALSFEIFTGVRPPDALVAEVIGLQ